MLVWFLIAVDLEVLSMNPTNSPLFPIDRRIQQDELIDFVEFTKDKPVDVRFIEVTILLSPTTNKFKNFSYKDQLKQLKQLVLPFLLPVHAVRSEPVDEQEAAAL